MGNVIFGINISIDGCCDHTKFNPDEEIHDYFTDLLRDAHMLAYGRKTYQLMVPFWPDVAKNHTGETNAINEFALAFSNVSNIVVFSQTLPHAEGKNTRIVRTNPVDEIIKLKQEQDGNILLGGVTVPSLLIEAGLVDEYHFVVHPILAGEGVRLFKGISLPEQLQLSLVASKHFKSGAVAHRYLK